MTPWRHEQREAMCAHKGAWVTAFVNIKKGKKNERKKYVDMNENPNDQSQRIYKGHVISRFDEFKLLTGSLRKT